MPTVRTSAVATVITATSGRKLDGSFMTDYARSPEQQARVRDLASAGSAVGATTIACDVNDSGSMTTLFLAGVEFVQGNFLAPASADLSFDF